jgi:hypothetical protein
VKVVEGSSIYNLAICTTVHFSSNFWSILQPNRANRNKTEPCRAQFALQPLERHVATPHVVHCPRRPAPHHRTPRGSALRPNHTHPKPRGNRARRVSLPRRAHAGPWLCRLPATSHAPQRAGHPQSPHWLLQMRESRVFKTPASPLACARPFNLPELAAAYVIACRHLKLPPPVVSAAIECHQNLPWPLLEPTASLLSFPGRELAGAGALAAAAAYHRRAPSPLAPSPRPSPQAEPRRPPGHPPPAPSRPWPPALAELRRPHLPPPGGPNCRAQTLPRGQSAK